MKRYLASIRRRVFAAGVLSAALWLPVVARGHEHWAKITGPVGVDLLGVAAGPSGFVAVGANGAILTSTDGTAWLSRASGTEASLTGIGYGEGRFVAVGADGTIVVSADGGASWVPRESGTSNGLNSVCFADGEWLVVGERRIVLSSPDTLAWKTISGGTANGSLVGLCHGYGKFLATGTAGVPIQAFAGDAVAQTGTTAVATNLDSVVYARHRYVAAGETGLVVTSVDGETWHGELVSRPLRAITYFDGCFVAAADDGSVLTSPDARTWTLRDTGNSNRLTAVAANSEVAIAVGVGGTLLRSTATVAPPEIVSSPSGTTEVEGNNVQLDVIATGTAPLVYQLKFNGTPIAGATEDVLPLLSVSAGNEGAYMVDVSNALGVTTSAAAVVTVRPAATPIGPIFDATFRPPNGIPITCLTPQNDGRVIVAGDHYLARLNADGSPDWTVNSDSLPAVSAVALQPDGKVLVGGSANGAAYLVRFTDTGQSDATFTAAQPSLGAVITQVLVAPDGKILVANATPRLLRLNSDGGVDPTFVSADISSLAADANSTPVIKLVALAPDGRILFAASSTGVASPRLSGNVLLGALGSDGLLDSRFQTRWTGASEPRLLAPLPDGKVLLASDSYFAYFGGIWSVLRFNADGSSDDTFSAATGSWGRYGGTMRAAVDPQGRIVVTAGTVAPYVFQVRRFLADGTIDSSLTADLTATENVTGQSMLPVAAVADSAGRILVVNHAGVSRLLDGNADPINPPAPISDISPALQANSGDGAVLTPSVAGTGPFTFSWSVAGLANPDSSTDAATGAFTLRNVRTATVVIATATNRAGTIRLPPFRISVPPQAPGIAYQPTSLAIAAGRAGSIPIHVSGSGPLAYQWFFNQQPVAEGTIAGFDDGSLRVYAMNPDQEGQYFVVITNALGSVTSAPIALSIDHRSRLLNISGRGFAGVGDDALIAGFTITGTVAKTVLIRGVGPSLAAYGVDGFLRDPMVTVYDAAGKIVAENDSWSQQPGIGVSTFPLSPLEAQVQPTLPPGSYTVRVAGAGGTTGVALAEVYESTTEAPRLSNVSVRANVGPGARAAICGIVVGGTESKRLLVRAVGPTLAQYAVTNPLANPELRLIAADGSVVATNDDWGVPANPSAAAKSELVSAAATVGAFPLPDGSLDAAMIVTIAPGAYTAVVTGADDATGTALVEAYELP